MPAVVGGVVTTDGTVLTQAGNVLAGASFVSIGATPALTGNLRLPNVSAISFRSGAADLPLIATTSAAIQIGNQTSIGSCETYANFVRLWGSSATDIYNTSGAGFALHITAATFEVGQPIIGGNSTPYGVHGHISFSAAGAVASISVTAAQCAMSSQVFTGARTAIADMVYPAATDATAYYKWVQNSTTGGFSITIKNGALPTGVVLSGGGTPHLCLFNSAGVTQLI